jgi:KDO2-lipid IV(A) lauroyltransferase
VRHALEAALFWCVWVLSRLLPRGAYLALGEALGRLVCRIDRRHRDIAAANFKVAFPDASSERAHEVVSASYGFFGRYMFDLVTCYPSFPASYLDRFELEGLQCLKDAVAEGRGVLCFTGHWGGWEFQAIATGRLGHTIASIARRLDNPHLERILVAARTSTGNLVIEKREGVRPILKALRDGHVLAILIDQNVSGEEHVFVDFFGRPAATTPALGVFHLRTGAPLVPVFALPLPGGRYRLRYGPRVEVPLSGDRDEDVRRVTHACTKVLEAQIREHPEFWLWMHRRWKTQPGPGESVYAPSRAPADTAARG